MSTEIIIVETPTVEQLTSVEKNVLCTQEGCGKTFIHKGALRMHLVKSHGQKKDISDRRLFHKGKVKQKLEYHFNCPVVKCQYSDGEDRHFNCFHKLKQHYMKVHAERCHECSKCERTFSRENDLHRHEAQCGKLYECGTCPVKYTTTEALITHCKRQDHTYPEKYKKKNKKNAPKEEKPTVTKIPVIPVMLISVPPPTPKPPPPPKLIKPKPRTKKPAVQLTGTNGTSVKDTSLQEKASAPRQDALIQTDIFGVSSLSVSGQHSICVPALHNTHHSSKKKSIEGASRNNLLPPKSSSRASRKSPAAKRKLGLSKDSNPSSPRRKKLRSSTGIQTSVSLTRKQRQHTVSGTQTTGDYILKTAMAQADIQIERKTVGSQVTPHKQPQPPVVRSNIETQTFTQGEYSLGRSQPVLVDSYSQVKQRNIWAETSHNLAESQTMTDLPPSISTQTLQSYLVNQKERRITKKQITKDRMTNFGNNVLNSKLIDSDHISLNSAKVNGDNVVKIYDANLSSSVSFVAPGAVAAKPPQDPSHCGPIPIRPTSECGTSTNDSPQLRLSDKANQQDVTPSLLPPDSDFLQTLQPRPITYTANAYSISEISDQTVSPPTSLSTWNQSYAGTSVSATDLGTSGGMTDTEAQAMMSADEFESLLHSSGIFLDNDPLSHPMVSHSTHLSPVTSVSKQGMDKQRGQDFDFISCHVNTADINTQTGTDLGLFDSYSSIDTNTQTVGDIDFLDLVMTNMETQTLNDNDLIDLGLVNSSISTQSLGVGTSDFDWTSPHNNMSQYCSTGSDTADIFISPNKAFNDLDQNKYVNQSKFRNKKNQSSNQSTCDLLHDDSRINTSVMETQTVSLETAEPLMQTETQTQVEFQDLETMNMETQTTLEDLQQLCDWF